MKTVLTRGTAKPHNLRGKNPYPAIQMEEDAKSL